MPLASGLGSSAASSVAGAMAVNELFDRPLSKRDLLPHALAGERAASGSAHADNAAPSLLGGFVLIRGYDPLDVIDLPVPAALRVAVVHPQCRVETAAARALLRGHLFSIEQAVSNLGNLGALVTGLFRNDLELVGRSIEDELAEPLRARAHSRIRGRAGRGTPGGRAGMLDLRIGAVAVRVRRQRRGGRPHRRRDAGRVPGRGRPRERELRRTREHGWRLPGGSAVMILVSTTRIAPPVTFEEALLRGLAPDGGLYLPTVIPGVEPKALASWRGLPIGEVAVRVLSHLVGDEFDRDTLERLTREAFDFPAPTVPIADGLSVLELFHGPTLAFKDFGARFLARVFGSLLGERGGHATILVATSGDTGSAVAQGFHGVPRVRVVVLYPAGKVSPFQEAQMATLGGNVTAVRVPGTFDDCQRLVKQAFLDERLAGLGLSSANSINIGRLLPQAVYYVASWLAAGGDEAGEVVFAVPSGNLGNLTAGVIAQRLGVPVGRFIAATNVNAVLPDYLRTGTYLCPRRAADALQRDGRRRPEQLPAPVADSRRGARCAARQRGRDLDRRGRDATDDSRGLRGVWLSAGPALRGRRGCGQARASRNGRAPSPHLAGDGAPREIRRRDPRGTGIRSRDCRRPGATGARARSAPWTWRT